MKNSLILLFLFPLFSTGYAQNFKVRNWDRLRFELPLTNMIAPGYQRFGFRAVYNLGGPIEFSAGGSYGPGITSLFSATLQKTDQTFYEVGVGGRYFFSENNKKKRKAYAEIQINYRPEMYYKKDDWFYSNGNYIQYGGALVSKKTWFCDMLLGRQKQVAKGIFMHTFLGIGVRFNQIRHIAFTTEVIDKPILGSFMQKLDRQEGFSIGVIPKIGVNFYFKPFIATIKSKRR